METANDTARASIPDTSPGIFIRLRRALFGSDRDWSKNLALSSMAMPGVLFLFVFAYLPMFGLIIAFTDYRFADGIFGSEWVGFENFRFLFGTDIAIRITRNTLVMNSLFIVTSTIGSIAIALLLNEVFMSRVTKFYQTLLFFPYFISWVIVSYFVFGFLKADRGLVNQLLEVFGQRPVIWYRSPQHWSGILVLVNLWNSVGFGSMIYLAGILGISPEFYEAATVDGASKLQQIRYITLPLIRPLVTVMVLLQLGRIFNADFGLFFFVPNDSKMLYPTTDVIDTFVYRSLITLGDISMAAAGSFYQSVVGFITVIAANLFVRRVSPDDALF